MNQDEKILRDNAEKSRLELQEYLSQKYKTIDDFYREKQSFGTMILIVATNELYRFAGIDYLADAPSPCFVHMANTELVSFDPDTKIKVLF